MGTSGSGASKATGGSNSKTIAQANLPNVKLTVSSFTLTTSPHEHQLYVNAESGSSAGISSSFVVGRSPSQQLTMPSPNKASSSGGGTTSSASPQTSALGSGSALDVTPSYYTCHMWLRLT